MGQLTLLGVGPSSTGSGPPSTTFRILTEASDNLVTEASDFLVTEAAP